MDYQTDSLPRISVVVPVYNTKPDSLLACIESLEKQSSPAFELLFVDDGSQDDGCLEVLRAAERKIPFLRVIYNQHQGVSVARNTGVAQAKGDYILFVDSDDRIPPHMLERGQHAIVESGRDVVMGYLQVVGDAATPSEYECNKPHVTFYKANDMLLYHLSGSSKGVRRRLEDGSILKIGPVARLVKADLARRIPFPEQVTISEDTLWSLRLFLNTGEVAVVEDVWYWYYKGGQSASSGVHPLAATEAKKCLLELKSIVDNNKAVFPESAVLARVLGEVSRVARTWYSFDECEMSFTECVREMNSLLDCAGFDCVGVSHAATGGPLLLLKYLLCRSGLFIHYWRIHRLVHSVS